MCVVSMVGDHYSDKWGQPPYQDFFKDLNKVSREEFNRLKQEVEEMKQLLIKAKIYDEKNNEPHCEMENKIAMLREIAKLFNIDLNDVLKATNDPK